MNKIIVPILAISLIAFGSFLLLNVLGLKIRFISTKNKDFFSFK